MGYNSYMPMSGSMTGYQTQPSDLPPINSPAGLSSSYNPTSSMAPSMPPTTLPNLDIPAMSHGGGIDGMIGGLLPELAGLAFNRGGKVPRGLIAVHMNPQELDVLDHLQGHRKHAPDHNRMYPDLEGVFRNAHIKSGMIDHAKQHYASGGHVGHMSPISASNGIHGDSQIAYIGPHMRQVFNEALGHKYDRNPYDGHPQYYGLGDFFNSIGSGLKSVWRTVSPYVGPIGRTLLPVVSHGIGQAVNTYAPGMGPVATGVANHFGGNLLDKLIPQGPQTEFQQNANNAIQGGINNYVSSRQSGAPMNNIGDFGRAVAGSGGIGGAAKTAANLGSSFLRSNPQLAPSSSANPLLQMGHRLASQYNNQVNAQQPQEDQTMQPAMA